MKAPRKFWTEREDAMLNRCYAHTPATKIARRLDRSTLAIYKHAHELGLYSDRSYLKALGAGLVEAGRVYRFPKGHVPANKGLRRPGYVRGRMAETQFKPGERSGFAEHNWKPMGTVLADPDGYLRIKVRERVNGLPAGWNKEIWPLLHHRVWEEDRGPIPPGHKVVFIDRNRANCAIENLELITDAEMMARNTMHKLPKPLVSVIRLNGILKRRLRRLDEEHDDRLAKPPVRDAGAVEGQGRSNGY